MSTFRTDTDEFDTDFIHRLKFIKLLYINYIDKIISLVQHWHIDNQTNKLNLKIMKTIIFTLSTLILLISNKINTNYSEHIANKSLELTTEMSPNLSSSSIMVKATNYQGEIIPFVQLITLDVFGKVERGTSVKTVLVDGERIPVVTLPVLNIISE